MAHTLRARGVVRGSAVALLLPRGIELIVAMLAVQKAGGYFVPVDPVLPDARIDYLLQDSAPVVAISSSTVGASERIASEKRLLLDVDRLAEDVAAPSVELTPDDAVYAIYTSGSTGKPKGALNFQKGVANLYTWFAQELELDAQTRSLVVGSLSFDLYHKGVFAPLLSGGCVVLYASAAFDAAEIRALVASEGVTLICATPSAFNGIIEHAGERGMAQLASLRRVSLGGEVVQKARLRPWLSHPSCAARVINTYGPTECADIQSYHWITADEMRHDQPVPIGRALRGCELYALDADMKPVAAGEVGRLWLGGTCVGGGYLNLPDRTAQAFLPNPFRAGERMYDTGDLVSWNAAGELDYRGRADRQVKIRGYRIELDEVEAQLAALPGVIECAATAPVGPADERVLRAYVRMEPGVVADISSLRRQLAERVPDYLVPSVWVMLERFPYNNSGKIDRNALPEPAPSAAAASASPQLTLEQRIAERWRELIGLDRFDHDTPFIELGGTSLLAVRFVGQLAGELDVAIPMVDFFAASTVNRFSTYLRQRHAAAVSRWTGENVERVQQHQRQLRRTATSGGAVAVVGMACRVPGADDVEVLWQHLLEGRDTLQRDPEWAKDRGADWVSAAGWLDHADCFDHEFFRYTPREAAITDPQQRILLECAWHALEHAGIAPDRSDMAIGVYAGLAANSYLTRNLASHAEFREFGMDYASIGNDKDFAATRIAYKLDLRGPAMTIQTGCSSSGTALHMACLALQAGDCDAAIVGGSSLPWRYRHGHRHVEDGPLSRDGYIRSFDARASGMVLTGGVACVVLKRLADAQADGDTIHSVIRATALNNDGSNKAAFTAPNVEQQTAVIRRALQRAGVSADDISCVEAHGTGTPLGDPIEIAGLTRAYREDSQRTGYCAIGSVKGNIGHLDAGAACAGLIKLSLALTHRKLPRQPHFEQPHPECRMEQTPFQVHRETVEWRAAFPRRAGLSSFGFGGTNFHAVIEEAPAAVASSTSSRKWHVLRLSAKNGDALARQAGRMAAWRVSHPDAPLADAAWTLDVGRARLAERGALVVSDAVDPARLIRGKAVRSPASLVFVFPGQGAQHPGMGRQLYRDEPVFRQAVDRCAEVLGKPLGFDLRELLFSSDSTAAERLRDTSLAQPAIYTISYALAQTWMSWGYQPGALAGHSVGEFVAATLAGVFTLEDALAVLAERAALMRSMPAGSMLAVRLGEDELRAQLPDGLDLAAVNASQLCVVSGPAEAVAAFADELRARGVATTPLHTSHAFHSSMMDPVVQRFEQVVQRHPRGKLQLPLMSTVTARWLLDSEATDPAYWSRQLRHTVRFAPAMAELLKTPGRVLLEVGPGQSLAAAMRQMAGPACDAAVVASMPHAQSADADDHEHAVQAMARLWLAGIEADPARYYAGERRNRIGLPGYPFARVRHWIDPARTFDTADATAPAPATEIVAAAGAAAAPPTIEQQVLAALLARSGIEVTPADADRTFLEIGFDSLLLTQLAADLKQRFSVDLRFRQLLRELPTPRALIAHLQQRVPEAGVRQAADDASESSVPVARGQARLGRDAEGNPAWFVPDPEHEGAFLQLVE
ncbi:MAG TPA: amino acid adenylation domain-containing protein [Nevskiaceae bacterium]|nr:amino acid adenylation domain-containing protein [Nevskiaceae bacterium]